MGQRFGLWQFNIPVRTSIESDTAMRHVSITLPAFSVVKKATTGAGSSSSGVNIAKEQQWFDLWPSRPVIQADFTNVVNKQLSGGLLHVE